MAIPAGQMARKSLLDDLREFPLRRIGGLVALALSIAILDWRVQSLRARNHLELTPRAAKIMKVKGLTDRLLTYSTTYGRPVFAWTGVWHMSPAESTMYENLRLALRDSTVEYRYSDESFTVSWFGEGGRRDTVEGRIALTRKWPAEAALYAKTRWMAYDPGPYR
jgi:hypothetical protein